MSAYGTKRTSQLRWAMSAIGGIADNVGGGFARSANDPRRTLAVTPTSPFRGAIVHPVGLPAVGRMRRREFITLIGGAAAWPLTAHAQHPERVRRIGVLLPAAADDQEFQVRIAAFHQGLALSGWTIGGNVRIDTRWAKPNAAEIRRHAVELAALAPDVILAHGNATVGALLQATRTVPIVFPVVADPVGAGFADSIARPGGNATGFMTAEYSIGGKRLELLKQIAPGVTRVAILRDATQGVGTSEFAAIQAVAPSLMVEVNPVNTRDAGEIERPSRPSRALPMAV